MLRPVPRSRRQYVSQSKALPIARAAGGKGGAVPDFIEPLLATARDKPPSGDGWVHEVKFDGYRLQLHRADAGTRCFTRRGYDWAPRFPSLVAAAWDLPANHAVIDGEVVVATERGDTDFAALESYVSSKGPERERHDLRFYAFDLLYLDGLDLRDVALIDRKAALAALIGSSKAGPVLVSEHLEGDGAAVLRNACKLELEGIVSKRKAGKYRSGRNDAWVKMTCRHRDTFVIAGLAYKGAKFDGVYLGREEGRKLVYAGKVEHGFSDAQVARLKAAAARLTVKKQPFDEKVDKPKGQWLKPALLGDVEYRRKTTSGLLRHPSYKGLREDLD
jgi:bifunctional non-homologous end joining protein LigD